MGVVGEAIGKWCSVNNLRKFSVRFHVITKPGENIMVYDKDEKEEWICETEAVNPLGEVKLKGILKLIVNCNIKCNTFE